MSLQIVSDAYVASKFLFSFLIGRVYGWNYTILTVVVAVINMKRSNILQYYSDRKKFIEDNPSSLYVAFVPALLGLVIFAEIMETCFSVISTFAIRLQYIVRVFPLTSPIYETTRQYISSLNDTYVEKRSSLVGSIINYITSNVTKLVFGSDAASGFIGNYLKNMFLSKTSVAARNTIAKNGPMSSPAQEMCVPPIDLSGFFNSGNRQMMSPPMSAAMSAPMSAAMSASPKTFFPNKAERVAAERTAADDRQRMMMKRLLNRDLDDKGSSVATSAATNMSAYAASDRSSPTINRIVGFRETNHFQRRAHLIRSSV